MREELDRKLCEKYPLLFKNRNAPMTETCMFWGFQHGDGWYQIIDNLCFNIQSHIDWSSKNNAWDLKWNEEHPDEQRPVYEIVTQVVVEQVKEKFGTLRFYYNGGDAVIDGMVRMAESMSSVMCEECGAPAKTQGHGWVGTLCDTHRKGYNDITKWNKMSISMCNNDITK
jgi:hypothetical protein